MSLAPRQCPGSGLNLRQIAITHALTAAAAGGGFSEYPGPARLTGCSAVTTCSLPNMPLARRVSWAPRQCRWQHFNVLGGKSDSRQNLVTTASSRTGIEITTLYSACYRLPPGLLLKCRQVSSDLTTSREINIAVATGVCRDLSLKRSLTRGRRVSCPVLTI
jgi:hypothetical protein